MMKRSDKQRFISFVLLSQLAKCDKLVSAVDNGLVVVESSAVVALDVVVTPDVVVSIEVPGRIKQ
jgi:hypothetical protein